MSDLYYVYGMSPAKRAEAKVFTRTEAKKLSKSTLLCGGTFYLKKHEYGLLYCLPENYKHWEEWAKAHGGKIIEWEDGILLAPNGKVIFTENSQQAAAPVDALTEAQQRIAELEAEVARLQRERDSAVRDADKRALLLREIEFYTDPKRRLDGQALSDKLDSIHARIVYVTASLSVPESEATDGA